MKRRYVTWPEAAQAAQVLFPPETRRYRFRESALLPDTGRMILATVEAGLAPGMVFEEDDLLVLFHRDTPEEVLGRMVNQLRDQGHRVEVERAAAPQRRR